jgi:integrase
MRRPGWILITPRKTAQRLGKPLHIPIHPALRAMLEIHPPRQRTGFVLPKLAGLYQVNRDRITRDVQNLICRCGVQIHVPGTGRQRDPQTGEEAHTGKRAVLQYGFHSLRHTTVTLLQEAGVPRAVVQEIVGHATVAMTQCCTHIGREALEKAVAQLPAAAPTREGRVDSAGMLDADEQRDRQRLRDLVGILPVSEVRRMLASVDAPPGPA